MGAHQDKQTEVRKRRGEWGGERGKGEWYISMAGASVSYRFEGEELIGHLDLGKREGL